MAVITARLQGGRSFNSDDGQRAGRSDSPLHSKETVQRVRMLDVEDEVIWITGDGDGRLHS